MCQIKHVYNFFTHPLKGFFGFKVDPPKLKESPMLDLSITNEQKITVTLNPVTSVGTPVALDGPPTWQVSSGDSTVNVSEDGLSAELVSSDTPGDTTYVVSADADLGEGVVNISDSIHLVVEGARATSLGLVAGEPVAK